MAELAVGIIGVGGRMGMMILDAIISDPTSRVSGGVVRKGSDLVGRDLGELLMLKPIDIQTTDQLVDVFLTSDVVIDFSLPEACVQNIDAAVKTLTPMVIGTTGLTKSQEKLLKNASDVVPLVYASNTSLGINLLFALVEQISRALPNTFDIEILDFHHRKKVDAPSGTALSLGHAAAQGRNTDLDIVGKLSRGGDVGARVAGEIGFAALRGGDVIGEHSVIFAGGGERIEISHKTAGREIYASGALRAAHWVVKQVPSLYEMKDVLGLSGSK
jgi:4-hydroxy-tetrahydrodipicolinate reductase